MTGNDMTVSPSEMNVLRRLDVKGEVIYGGTRPGSDMSKLIEAGLAKETSLNLSNVVYEITDAGRKAIEEH
jgi:hypothetical protein